MLVSLDLETTGTKPLVDRPVQIGLVSEQDGVRRTLINTYVNPGMPIAEEAQKVHGISYEKVQYAPDAAVSAWNVELLLGALGGATVVTFNGETFDVPMLDQCLGRKMVLPGPHIDVLSVAYRFFPGLPSYKLSSIYEQLLGAPPVGAHDATADAGFTLDLLKAIRVKIGMTVEQLVEEMAVPKPYSLFPFGKHKGALLADVPRSYGIWALANFDSIRPDLRVSLELIAGVGHESYTTS
jgi:DNA polymerase III epsilon subunit-like protein